MNDQEKMWYTVEEALNYLHLEESVFWRKMILFNFETRPLPGIKGTFISRHDLLFIEQSLHAGRLGH